MVGDNDRSGVGDLLVSVGHQHSSCAGLYIGLSIVITLTQAPGMNENEKKPQIKCLFTFQWGPLLPEL